MSAPDPRPEGDSPEPRGLLSLVALQRPELRAWALYDVANSAFYTVVVASIFPAFFESYAAQGSELALSRFGLATTVSLLVAALAAPLLGAMADYAGLKKKLLVAFMLLGVVTTACMFFIGPGDWVLAAVLFGMANIGVAASTAFYDALLPSVAREGELDRLSTTAYGLGYLGGGLLLAFNVLLYSQPGWFGLPTGENLTPEQASLPIRLGLLAVAVWWLVFTIPLMLRVREPARMLEPDEQRGQGALRVAFVRLGETFRELRRYRQALLLLVAFLIYNDGIGTMMRMAVIYGTSIGIEQSDLILAILLVQFVGIPFALLFGQLAGRFGAKRSVLGGLVVYLGICLLAYGMTTAWEFYLLAVLVGLVQGGCQALSRSLFASMIPKHKAGEFFGLFAVLEKFAGVLGPLAFTLAITLTGEARLGILALIVFFLLGGFLLTFVRVEEGQAAARAADLDTRRV